MKIIIIANFTCRLDGEREGRFSFLMESLADRGHDVELITTDFYHASKSRRPTPKQELYRSRITLCHEPGYKKNVSLIRLYSHWVWGHNVYKYLRSIEEKPDLVYCAIPSLTAAKLAAKYCKEKNVKFVTDVQDLWPEAFRMVIHNKILQKLFFPMQHMANQAYAASDLAVAVSDTYVNRTLSVNKKNIKGVTVFLGNDGAQFESEKGKYKVDRNGDELLLCYIGGLKDSYDIPCVIDAMALVKSNPLNKHVRFIIIGDGPFRQRFERYAIEKHVNCLFLGKKPYAEMASLLSSCDMCVNPIVRGSAASIINKVGDYALAGLPVINTLESPEYRSLIDEYRCGINCECGNAQQVANAIIKMASDNELRTQMSEGSRRLGKEKFDRRNTYLKIIEAIETL